jgi:hypothetical protein
MRTLIAIALILGGTMALSGTADARRSARHHPYPRYHQHYYYGQPRYYYRAPRYYSREQAVCEERAQAADPTGLYAGYPCWAREAFGRGSGGRR